MAQIVPKLNLNKTPSLVENHSLVFAKNIRADIDGSIHKDYSITNIFKDKTLLERLKEDFNKDDEIYKYYYNLINDNDDTEVDYEIIDVISNSTDFYILLYIIKTEVKTETDTETGSEVKTEIQHKQSIIVKYNEDDETLYPCNCNWNYSDGSITGLVVNNLLNETLLVIAESSETDKIPLKCINLDKSKYTDDETIYTQTPNIPFVNLLYIRNYECSIPNGVYQFFVRYKIRENYYTSWFPASKELFAGNKTTTDTIYGTIKYHRDVINSDNSFVLYPEILFAKYNTNFESYQIGFIVSNKQTSKARAWKHFSFDTKSIYFDYKSEDAEEINIEDFTNPVFGLYNVKNIEIYNNKLYISNYEEFNFNENFNVEGINVSILDTSSNLYDINNTGNYTFTTLYYDKHVCTIDSGRITNINYYDNESIYNILTNKGTVDIIYDTINTRQGGTYTIKFSKDGYNVDTNIKVQTTVENEDKYDKTYKMYFRVIDGLGSEHCYGGLDINYDNIALLLNNIDKNVSLTKGPGYFKIEDTYDIIIAKNNPSEKDYKDDDFTIKISITFDTSLITESENNVTNISTLLPEQKYNVYIHYVKQTGETTNGIFVKSIWIPYKDYDFHKPIGLNFSKITIPENFVCCFFSIVLVENKVSTVIINKEDNVSTYDGYCVDLNCGLNFFPKNMTLYGAKNDTDVTGTYHDSNDTNVCRYFGAEGLIKTGYNKEKALIINNYKETDYNLTLIKATSYITNNTYFDIQNENLLGFVCEIYPLSTTSTTKIYNDGTNIYTKNNDLKPLDFLNIKEFNKYKENDSSRNTAWLGNVNLIKTSKVYIYSNFNLNYLQLSNDIKPKYTTYYKTSETNNSAIRNPLNNVLFMIESLLLSTMYELDYTYYKYDRKYYYTYNIKDIYIFNNTIRCSIKNSDEDNLNIFKFEANDYYNIPTNKGNIINIKNLGDILLIHTKYSMFKFTGHNTLQSNNGDVQQTENDIFNIGASEIFSSEFGYAGLYDKKNSITTMTGYIFYDKNANIIYAYSGNGQLAKLSDSIEKLFRYDNITNVSFANDYYNNRFFICLHYSNNKTLTLSYCFNEEIKSFISIHDFAFENAFNTRTKCYFITNDKKQISFVDKTSFGLYPKFNTLNSIYPSYELNGNGDNIKYASIIDIIENVNYENIKTLNFISWNNAIVETEFPTYENTDKPFNALESKDKLYPCRSIILYTDSCSTGDISCIGISNNNNIDKIRYYKLPRYNQGLWTLNYFRNILNSNNNTSKYSGDNNSLIEGKYFVARFILDGDFKFETINFNYDIKL